jgi:hypothetical protein
MSSVKFIKYSLVTREEIALRPAIGQVGVVCMKCNNSSRCVVCNNHFTDPKVGLMTKKGEDLIKSSLCGSTMSSVCLTCGKADDCVGHVYSICLNGEVFYKTAFVHYIKLLFDKICLSCESVLIKLNDHDRQVLQAFHYTKQITPELVSLRERVRKQDKICQNCGANIVKIKYKTNRSYFAISAKISCVICNNSSKGCEVCNLQKYNMAPSAMRLYRTTEKVVSKHEHYIILHFDINPCDLFYVGYYPCPEKNIRVEQFTFDQSTNQAPNTTAIVQMLKTIDRISQSAPGDTRLAHRLAEIQRLIDNSEILRGEDSKNESNLANASYYSMGVVSKNATVRQYINGSRPNSTCKTVLGLTPNINIEHCYMPNEYQDIMTSFVHVNKFTIDLIEPMILEGEVHGYYSLLTNKYQSTYKAHKVLRYGDMAEVRFITGPESFVMIGRYPSLHQYSIIVNAVMPCSNAPENNQTIRFSLCHFPNMNADQDGDDAYSVKTSVAYSAYEMMLVMRSSVSIISPSDGSQSHGVTHDEIVNICRLVGKRDITTASAFKLLGKQWKRIVDRFGFKPIYTGNELLACLYPKHLNKDGLFVDQLFLKKSLQMGDVATGPSTINSIGRPINELYGRYAMYMFNSTLIHIARESLDLFPFSIGLPDYISSIPVMKENIRIMKEMASKIQENFRRYKHDVDRKAISPLDVSELSKMFLSEFEKIYLTIKLRLSAHFEAMEKAHNAGQPKTNLWLLKNSGFKMSIDTMQTICGQMKCDESISLTSFWQRLRPTAEVSSYDVYANGLIRYPLFHGYDMNDKLHLLIVARRHINNIVTATSKKGEAARKITKCLEDMVINELGWISYERTTINSHNNSFHLLNDYLVIVSINLGFIENLTDSRYTSELRKSLRKVYRYMVSEDGTTINTNMASPLDFDMILSSAPLNYEPERIHMNSVDKDKPYSEDELLDLINWICEYILSSYMIKMGYTESLRFLLLYFLCPQKRRVTHNSLTYMLDMLDLKYKRGNTPGTPFGMRASLAISQKETQASLSAFHEFSKTGTSIKNIAQNDNSRFTHLKAENQKGLLTIFCKDYEKLLVIKRGQEWLTLRMVYEGMSVAGFKSNPLKFKYNVSLSVEKLASFSVSLADLIDMTSRFVGCFSATIPTISAFPSRNEHGKLTVMLVIVTEFSNRKMKWLFDFSMLDGINKGLSSKYNIEIDETEVFTDSLVREKTYKLSMFLSDITKLSMYDTSDMTVILPAEEVSHYFGMVYLLNCLSYSYVSEGLDRLNYVTLSMFQTRQITPRSILKFKLGECSTIKAITYGTGFKDYPHAAVHNKKERCDGDISSCILNNLRIRVGTGYYQTYYDINMISSENEESNISYVE